MTTTPEQPTAPQPVAHNGFGITALALALIGLVFGFVPLTGFLALILGVLAILFGLLGLARVRKGQATNKKMSWFGTGLGVGAAALGIWGITIVFGAVEQFDRDMQKLDRDLNSAPGQQRAEVAPEAQPVEPAPVQPQAPAAPAPTEPPATAPGMITVTVKATGDLGTADVNYSVGDNYGTTTESLPFSVTENVPADDPFSLPATIMVSTPMPEDVSADWPQGTIGCQVLVDGAVVDENSASTGSSGYASANCTQP